MAEDGGEKPLRKIADAFKDLAITVNSQDSDLKVAPFSEACAFVSPLFSCLGIAFKFAEMDYVAKVKDLAETSNSILTLQAMIDQDIQTNTVRKQGSHTRNLLRVKRGLDMVKVLFEQIIASELQHWSYTLLMKKELHQRFRRNVKGKELRELVERNKVGDKKLGDSLKDAASKAYADVFAPYHGWTIRKAVGAGMYALPTRPQLMRKLNEDDNSARVQMQSYISSSEAVIGYIDRLFHSKELGIDW